MNEQAESAPVERLVGRLRDAANDYTIEWGSGELYDEAANYIEWLEQEISRLRDALSEYANPLNWEEDKEGIRRVWLEPGSTTPEAYNGFEAANAVLTHNAKLTCPPLDWLSNSEEL